MTKQTILLLFGGASSEHDVSLMSARNVDAALDRNKYDVVHGYITRMGEWRLVDSFDELSGPTLQPLLGRACFTTGGRTVAVDVVFPVLHGKNGEDGTVQGLLELVGVPYVGCKVTASALCMDKAATKRLAQTKTARWVECKAGDPLPADSKIKRILGNGPWFVKPCRAGSSVGVSKVTNLESMATAIELAHQHDGIALIEEAIVGREIEVAVLGNGSDTAASPIGEIISGAEFYDYNDKYSAGSQSNTIIDPDMPDVVKQTIRDLAREIYQRLGCRGLSRVDFFLTDNHDIYLNEVNTMPGFTNISMYPKLWQEAGTNYSDLVDHLIHLAHH